jgi:hypothetical protein
MRHSGSSTRPALATALALLLAAAGSVPAAAQENVDAGGGARTYRVTLVNLTTGQPFSPPLLATHTHDVDVFTVGRPASDGVRLIAEDGDNASLTAALNGTPGVHQVVASSTPLHRLGGPGSAVMRTTIEATGAANRLSIATMLICTNDGFSGVDSVRLPGGFVPSFHLAQAYDASTEANEQTAATIVDPCGAIGPVSIPADGLNQRPATSGVIAMHPGIVPGKGILTAAHVWRGPVLAIIIQRVK